MNKIYELHILTSFICSNNADEKIVILNTIKWYKDLCEGVYRDTSIILYICCDLLKNKSYDSSMLNKPIGFSDIVNRFSSLSSKYKLDRLTDGVNQIIRHAEAHVDYEINNTDRVINFRNKKKGLNEEISFDEFMELFSHLQETINVIINAFEIFLLNHDDFIQLAKDVHSALETHVPITQADMVPLLRGIIITNKTEKEVDGEYILQINGICIKDEGLGSCENLLSIFYTIVKYDEKYDKIFLNVDDSNGNLLCAIQMETRYLKELDLENSNSIYMLGFIRYIFNSKLPSFPNKKNLINDMYFNIITHLLDKIKGIVEMKRGLLFGNSLPISLTKLAEELVSDCEYILYILEEAEDLVIDKRLNMHMEEVINRMKSGFSKLSICKKADMKFDINNQAISKEIHCLVDIIKLFKGEINEKDFYLAKTKEDVKIYRNVGRNDSCPCGSGKKYKKCHGANIND